MSITFVVLRQSGQRYDRTPLTADDSELSLSNENAHDVLDALGIEDPYSSSPWPIAPFCSLLTATRRKRLGHQSAAIATTERSEPGCVTMIECGRPEGYVERRLKDLSNLVNRGLAAGSRPSSIRRPRLLRFKLPNIHLPNIHAHELAAERAQVPALGRLLAIEQRSSATPRTSSNSIFLERPLDRQPQAAPKPANASPD
jgi:hypothetical protein